MKSKVLRKCSKMWSLNPWTISIGKVFHRGFGVLQTVQLSSVQDDVYLLRKAHMRSTQSLKSFPNIASNSSIFF